MIAARIVAHTIPNDSVPALWFTKVPNVGDQVNPYLIEKLTGRPARLVEDPVKEPHILGIGSMMGAARNTSRVWGTGVMDPERPNLWIELSNEVVGGGFKFRDWFSLCRNPQQSAATLASLLTRPFGEPPCTIS